MSRVVVNVSTGHYVRGHDRLAQMVARHASEVPFLSWRDKLPLGCPTHREVPYAFKAAGLKHAASMGYRQLLWCDASTHPIRDLEPIWARAKEYGAWISDNGFKNSEWTAESAYPDLFPDTPIELARLMNREIKHVVATAFCLDLDHPFGATCLKEYVRLGLETKAFCGPWHNSNCAGSPASDGWYSAPCGPADVRGHRHDQTALSLIASQLGIPLTPPPWGFSYAGGENADTVLLAVGA